MAFIAKFVIEKFSPEILQQKKEKEEQAYKEYISKFLSTKIKPK